MKVNYLATLALVFSVCFAVFPSGQRPELSKKYDLWLNEEVAYIISPKEKEVFGKLETDRDRDLFIEEFWRQRDPTPGMPQNEFRDEHYRRIDYANKRFGGGVAAKGWRTDRGRTLIILGPPLDVEKFASPDICPVEIWYYLRDLRWDLSTFFRLLFFEEYGAEEFKLYNPFSDGPKRLVPFPERWRAAKNPIPGESAGVKIPRPASWTPADERAYEILVTYVTSEVAEASISFFPGFSDPGEALRSSALLNEIPSIPRNRIKDEYAEEFLARKAPVEVNYSVHQIESRSMVNVLQDPSGRFLVNYAIGLRALTVDFFQDHYFAGLRTSIRVTDAGGKTVFQDEKFSPVELTKLELKAVAESSPELHGFFALIPGTYTISLLLENTVSKEFTSIDKKISVPQGRQIQMSPLLLARNVVKSSFGEAGQAFRVGEIQIYPSLDNMFQNSDHLFVFFQVYGLGSELSEQGDLEYSLSSEGRVLQTVRRKICDSENHRDFIEEFSMEKSAPGTYTVKVALLDKEGKEVASAQTDFVISTKSVPGSWVVAQANPPAQGLVSAKYQGVSSRD